MSNRSGLPAPTPSTPSPIPNDGAREIVLPSGKFCKSRRLCGRDWVNGRRIADANLALDLGFILATMCITIDGETVTYEQLMDMDLRDVMPIVKIVGDYLSSPVR